MSRLLPLVILILFFNACKLMHRDETIPANHRLARMLHDYYEDRMKLFPLEATQNGDARYNDLLPVDFTDSYLEKVGDFYNGYLQKINHFNRDRLNPADQISFDVFKREMEVNLEGNALHFQITPMLMPNLNTIPFNQFEGIPLVMGQFGSGTGVQPFRTIADYDNWVKRASLFLPWADSAIVYFRRGLTNGTVLPKSLVVKMIPQMRGMLVTDPKQSLFYGPVNLLPASFDSASRHRLTRDYETLITGSIVPAYKRLADFLQNEYLPKATNATGYSALPKGDQYYRFLVRFWTTTDASPESIYQKGLSEVARIKAEMESVKDSIGHQEDMKTFFEFMKTDAQFMPYKTPEDVLNAFRKIQQTIDPNLKKMFGRIPKARFEIRQTEAFRAASASAEYNSGSPDGSRPGIFYVPILDAKTFNSTSGMECLFPHEAIPGHHYQSSLQQEDSLLPTFRRFLWYGAYGEGWALYCESLGKELGLYKDPYQRIAALSNEMHRAIRLVVDVAMHEKNMTREQAIKYMMDNEGTGEQHATMEVERYMAIPAQALSYKMGAMKIRALRDRYTQLMGPAFSLSAFHDEVLKDGCLPLGILESKMEAWSVKR